MNLFKRIFRKVNPRTMPSTVSIWKRADLAVFRGTTVHHKPKKHTGSFTSTFSDDVLDITLNVTTFLDGAKYDLDIYTQDTLVYKCVFHNFSHRVSLGMDIMNGTEVYEDGDWIDHIMKFPKEFR